MHQECIKCIWSDRQTPGVHKVLRAVPSGQPQRSSNPKILLIKVFGYDPLMMKIPIIGGLPTEVDNLQFTF